MNKEKIIEYMKKTDINLTKEKTEEYIAVFLIDAMMKAHTNACMKTPISNPDEMFRYRIEYEADKLDKFGYVELARCILRIGYM